MRLFFVTFLIFHYLFMDSNVESVPTAERKGSENQTVDEEQQLDQLRQPNENVKPDQDASGRKQKKNSVFQQNYSPKDYKRFSSIRFTPEDLAKYILKTGDEEGVTLAIEELLREKMLNREEAISYLQEIKNVITGLKNEFKNSIQPNVKKSETLEEPNINVFSTTEAPVVSNTLVPTKVTERSKKKSNVRPKEFHNEDTLQHVIYQLAKDMFKYSLTFGDQSAKESLAELITFLEMEVENKQISPFVKKKILDIISAALIDSLKEYPELISQEKKIMYNMKSNKENLYNSPKKQQMDIPSRNEVKKKIP